MATPQTTGQVIFSPLTPLGTLRSAVIEITNGHYIIVDAYNLRTGETIWLNKVTQAAYDYPQHPGCGHNKIDPRGPDGVVTGRNRMLLGGPAEYWALTPETPQLLISLPGRYEFELASEDMLDAQDLYVEYQKYPLAGYIPAGYQGGLIAAPGTGGQT